jgi:CRP/FNR family cyclic AMP-dependent transcriptional regulator
MVDAQGEPNFFSHLSGEARRAALARTHAQKVRKGQTIISRGAQAAEVYFIIEGRFQVVLYSVYGREVSLRDLGPGEMFGELAAIDGEYRSATVVAATDGRLLSIGRQDFNDVVDGSPALAAWLVRQMVAQIRLLTERIFELSALNVQTRLHCELLRLARASHGPQAGLAIRPAPTHSELANRIGTHREAVTREMRALSEQNIIRNTRRALEFIDLAGLEAVVRRQAGSS